MKGETYSIINDDYAVIQCKNRTNLYYGYEVTTEPDGEGEWCFRAKNGKSVIATYSASQLDPEANMMGDMAQMLLLGIAKLIDEGKL